MISLDRLVNLHIVSQGCTIFVPESVISRILLNTLLEMLSSLTEVSLNERENSKSQRNI
jgi:hypothetical protein